LKERNIWNPSFKSLVANAVMKKKTIITMSAKYAKLNDQDERSARNEKRNESDVVSENMLAMMRKSFAVASSDATVVAVIEVDQRVNIDAAYSKVLLAV